MTDTSKRGFASMDRQKQLVIASKGGITQCPTAFVAPVAQAGLEHDIR